MSQSRLEQVWETDYGTPELLLETLGPLADSISRDVWTTAMLYINNNPYNLELFVVVGVDPAYHEAQEAQEAQEQLRAALQAAGATQRSDLTIHDFTKAFSARRFNGYSILDSTSLEFALEQSHFPSRRVLEGRGFVHVPFGERPRVFLSHQADRKGDVYGLRDRLAARDLPTWMDVFDIDYGADLAEAIETGIIMSSAVVFWISRGFVSSSFCRFELRAFIGEYMARDNVLLLAALDSDVDDASLPSTLRRIKYLQLQDGQGAETIDAEFGPVLTRFLLTTTRR